MKMKMTHSLFARDYAEEQWRNQKISLGVVGWGQPLKNINLYHHPTAPSSAPEEGESKGPWGRVKLFHEDNLILYIGLEVIIDSSNEKIIELKKKNDRVIMVMIILDIYFFC